MELKQKMPQPVPTLRICMQAPRQLVGMPEAPLRTTHARAATLGRQRAVLLLQLLLCMLTAARSGP